MAKQIRKSSHDKQLKTLLQGYIKKKSESNNLEYNFRKCVLSYKNLTIADRRW
jgi:hypothetical protein